MPDVSVVIPTYNRKEYLRQAIASCLDGNNAVDVEIVVVDDGSSDGTRAYLEDLEHEQVRTIFQRHQGGQIARNRGLAEAQATYLKFLDDDDWLEQGVLTREVSALKQTGADVCLGPYLAVNEEGTVVSRKSNPYFEDFVAEVLRGGISPHTLHLTYRREFIRDLQWDPEIIGRQDVQFLVDVALREPSTVKVDQTVGYMRHHGGRRQSKHAAQETNLPRVHASILLRAVRTLEREGRLGVQRRQAAAEGLWGWAHILSAYDWTMFQKVYEMIRRIHPDFAPSRTPRLLKLVDQIGTPEVTEALLHPFRRLKYGL